MTKRENEVYNEIMNIFREKDKFYTNYKKDVTNYAMLTNFGSQNINYALSQVVNFYEPVRVELENIRIEINRIFGEKTDMLHVEKD